MSSEHYRWLLVDGFVERFNNHRKNYFFPSDLICVDESISRWYGQGGNWINHGLPMYVAIDRKPENGCKIQNSAFGRSGVMLSLRLVKSIDENENEIVTDSNNEMNHGTMILKSLCEPWAHSNRCVCADSYFSSVHSALELKKKV
jgi:hypothetical protein